MKFKVGIIILLAVLACGKLEEEAEEELAATPTPEPTTMPTVAAAPTETATPAATATATPAPETKIYVGSSTQRIIAGYTLTGTRTKTYDLSPYFTAGGVTAMKFVDASNMLAFFDVGAAGERVVRINIDTDEINAAWGIDATNLNNVTLNAIVEKNGILYFQKTTNIEKYSYNIANTLFTRIATGGFPITSTASCLITTLSGIIPVSNAGVDYLLQLSTGANNRVNTWSNVFTGTPACASASNSYNVTTTYPSAATYAAIGGVQMDDGKVYIRFTNSAGSPLLAKYDFNGTSITAGASVLADLGAFGASTTVRTQMAKLDSTTMLFSNWDNDFVGTVTTAGAWNVLIRDGYSVDVGAIAVKP